ncbi:MAG: S-layer homology domain-containing protein [Coprothermobacterota bacterium]|nr:S-layer homology domain-containing protein [Coprothermobacterota bacterium]
MNLAKKFLVVLITAAMLFTLVPLAAFAADTTTTPTPEPVSTVPVVAPVIPYSDIFGTPYESAFVKLHLMGVFTGYPDQTFKPDRPVTRSEFLAVTIRALNFEKYVSGFKGATQYPDTAIDHWATGYINMGTAFGIVKGYPDGTFRPDSNVSYAEATTMLVRMLGYTQYLTPVTPGGGTEDWFANFVKMAVAMGDPTGYGMSVHPPLLYLPEGMLTGVQNFGAASPASRGDLAIMTYNAMYIYPLGQFEWHTNGPVPGGMYFPTDTTLAENMGYHEMETFVTNAPNYDTYAGANELELFEGWTVIYDDTEVFIPYGQGWTDPMGKFWGDTNPLLIAAALGLKYPADFTPVHRLYSLPANVIWVGGQPASLIDLIGKPVRVIYNGSQPYIGQAPFDTPSTLWYIRILPCEVLTRKVAANKVGSYYFPGKTVGEIYADLKLSVYQVDTAAKAIETITLDPRAVIFLEDTQVENWNVMLIKDAEVKIVRGLKETGKFRDYEGHLSSGVLVNNTAWALLAKVWPGHIIKDAFVLSTSGPEYDVWGRTLVAGKMVLDFTDDNTFNKRVQTPYPTFSDQLEVAAEDDAKIWLDGAQITVLDSFGPGAPGYDTGTARLAPIKYQQGAWSLIKFEGAWSQKTGTLEEIYRTKDQWGNDWNTAIKVSGKVYDVLPPGRGEFPAIAASITGASAAPSAPVGQVGAVESGATFAGYEGIQVFNNLWDERTDWMSTSVDLYLVGDKVRYMEPTAAASATAYSEYGLVTRANMWQDATGYHLSLDIMMPDGKVKNFPMTEIAGPNGKLIVVDFSAYNDHNRGARASEWYVVSVTDYYSVKATWDMLQYLVRDLVKVTQSHDLPGIQLMIRVYYPPYGDTDYILVPYSYVGGDVSNYRFQELATNPNLRYNEFPSEGLIKQAGPTFDGTVFTLKDVNNTELFYDFPATFWSPKTIAESSIYTPFLAAKDLITVAWTGAPAVQQGTVIYDATMPPPNSPTPDGNITMKKMADLQREQFVQVFFQPAYESANPTMCDWMLVNGEKVPVVKFVVVRPLLGGKLMNIDEWPMPYEIISGAEFVGLDPQTGFENPIFKQFNQSLDLVRSSIWVYNTGTNSFIYGDVGFSTTVYQNDTIQFFPTDIEGWPITLPDGTYLVNATGYDAFTGGTQSLNFSWPFTSQHEPAGETTISGNVVGTGAFPFPLLDATVIFTWGTEPGAFDTVLTDEEGNYTWTHTFDGAYSGTYIDVTVDPDTVSVPPGTTWDLITPESIPLFTPYAGETFTGEDFAVHFQGME